MKLKTLKDMPVQEIIKEWLIEEKLSLGRMDSPLPKVSYGQLRRLLQLIRQKDREEAIKWYHRSDDNKHKFIMEFFNITEEDLK